MSEPLTLADAEALAARVLATIDYRHRDAPCGPKCASDLADRERIASDLAGLRWHAGPCSCCEGVCGCAHESQACPDRGRYAAGLRRTAALYGVQEGGSAAVCGCGNEQAHAVRHGGSSRG